MLFYLKKKKKKKNGGYDHLFEIIHFLSKLFFFFGIYKRQFTSNLHLQVKTDFITFQHS